MVGGTKPITSLFSFILLALSAFSTAGQIAAETNVYHLLYQNPTSATPPSKTQLHDQVFHEGKMFRWRNREPRRLMIGSTAPTCTYNECRGCKFRCRAEQIPVDGNDPIHSAYHYRCVCHR